MKNFLKLVFTWWNSQTIGTLLFTFFFGKLVGEDEFKNKYYKSKNDKRWVIFNNEVESTKIPPEWHAWIHYLINDLPGKKFEKYKCQKKHSENLTGTNLAFNPKKNKFFKKKNYNSWEPKG